jgi:hypothetical protein
MVTAQWRRCKTDADQAAFRRTTRMASNLLIGIPIRLAIGVLAERIQSMRRNCKTISEAGTIFQG